MVMPSMAWSISELTSLGIDLPTDPLTTEALIDLHKVQIELAQLKVEMNATTMAQQSQLTQKTTKFDKVKKNLEDRVMGAYNWLTFASNLNQMRLNLQTIYDLEKELMDSVRHWTFKLPTWEGSGWKGIKKSYDNTKAQAMVLYLGYSGIYRSSEQLKSLIKIFAIQFSGDMASNTFSGALKNLTSNLATDKQRRDFANRIFFKQDEIIGILRNTLTKIRWAANKMVKIDLIGSILNMLDYKTMAESVIETYTS